MLQDYVTPDTHKHLSLYSFYMCESERLGSPLMSSLIYIIKTLHLCMSPPGGSILSLVAPPQAIIFFFENKDLSRRSLRLKKKLGLDESGVGLNFK